MPTQTFICRISKDREVPTIPQHLMIVTLANEVLSGRPELQKAGDADRSLSPVSLLLDK